VPEVLGAYRRVLPIGAPGLFGRTPQKTAPRRENLVHTWSLLKRKVLSPLLSVGAELRFSDESDLVQALRESTQRSVSRAGDRLTLRNLQVQSTITIRPGAPVRLVVHRDLVLKPWPESR